MLNLLKLKKEKQEATALGEGGEVRSTAKGGAPADLKTGIEKNSWCLMEFPDPDDIMNFNVTLSPDEAPSLPPPLGLLTSLLGPCDGTHA
ncbi:hypothetical protein T484DRAFT_1813314 [Baffinella frigidus]|nr:hypothetical protein T484DRAFT_1813314 [Cryptophyta sp. CCMP2293]